MEITAEQYEKVKDSLPIKRGNVKLQDLQVLNAILYVAEQGCEWRGLPSRLGNWHGIYARMNRWARSGRIFPATGYVDTKIPVHLIDLILSMQWRIWCPVWCPKRAEMESTAAKG